MKQLFQNLANGEVQLIEVPAPASSSDSVVTRTSLSLVSVGTEKTLMDFGRAGWLDKARQQPDKVRMVLDKIRSDGLLATVEAVKSKLNTPLPLGYCNVGTVMEVGEGVTGFRVGDRVVSNGPHAEIVRVGKHLCAQIPNGVSDDAAAFTVLGAIALQGLRLANPTLGERFAVFGLGSIGLLSVQLLRANGCQVLGVDFDDSRLKLAREFGAQVVNLADCHDPVDAAMQWSKGAGLDGALITASTDSSEPVSQAARMCRKRGRIVLVGVTGLELSRADFYQKELSFQVSCSYGPGRYDKAYEEKGNDYPMGFVRWTEQRNFEAFLELLASGRINVQSLITHRVKFSSAETTYVEILQTNPLGVLFEYERVAGGAMQDATQGLFARRLRLADPQVSPAGDAHRLRFGIIGAGSYASRILLPSFIHGGAELRTAVSLGGATAAITGKRFGATTASNDVNDAIHDPEIDAVVIATRHDMHAPLVIEALMAGKHVFVEKPLALEGDDLDRIEALMQKAAADGRAPVLTVGFNRRFSPFIQRCRRFLDSSPGPKALVVTVNAGMLPPDHWTQDPVTGGGRILGEGCHFVDLLRYLVGFPISDASLITMPPIRAGQLADTATITLKFEDGSIGTIHYFANGHRGLSKERLEIYAQGKVLIMDNFRRLRGYGWRGFPGMRRWRQAKGQQEMIQAFLKAIDNKSEPPIPIRELLEVARATLKLASLSSH